MFQRGMKRRKGGNAPEDSSSQDQKHGPTRPSPGHEEEALILLPWLCVRPRGEPTKPGQK